MKALAAMVLGTLGIALPSVGWTRDLPRSDPDRRAILDAARGTEKVKLIVKDLFKAGDLAFLCSLKQDAKCGIRMTGEQIDVYTWVLMKEGGRWRAMDLGGDLAESEREVSCLIGAPPKRPQARGDLALALASKLRSDILAALDFGTLEEEKLALLGKLQEGKTAVGVEHEKDAIDANLLKFALENCGSSVCKQENQKAYRALAQWISDAKTSSLVWYNCQYGRRVHSVATIERCVRAMSARPYCRPNMKLPVDRRDIHRCVDEIRARCRRELPNGRC